MGPWGAGVIRGLSGGSDVHPSTRASLESSKKVKFPGSLARERGPSSCLSLQNEDNFSRVVKVTPFYIFHISAPPPPTKGTNVLWFHLWVCKKYKQSHWKTASELPPLRNGLARLIPQTFGMWTQGRITPGLGRGSLYPKQLCVVTTARRLDIL